MYEYDERKIKFNWKGFLLRLLLILIILVLVLKLLPLTSKKAENGHTKVFNNNLTKFKEVGNNYFNKDNLPKNGDEVKVTLRQLINNKKISSLKGADKKVCSEDKSYIKSYKKDIGYELEVYLLCGDESDKSYIYLGCFDDCNVNPTSTTSTTTTSTTTTTKKSSNNSNGNSSKKVTTKKTTTTTKIKKYAVIFNENGGSKVATQHIIEGKNAVKPIDPVKNGFIFDGWYVNNELYNFNAPVYGNVVLIAKWKINSDVALVNNVQHKTYNETIYGVATISSSNKSVYTKSILNIPEDIKSNKNVNIKSITYIRNFKDINDIKNYLDNKSKFYKYDEGLINSNSSMSDFGTVDNIEIKRLTNTSDKAVSWSGEVISTCNNSNDTCSYGIVYRVIWEYEI